MLSNPLIKLVLLPGVFAAALAYAATPFVIKFAWKFGLIDDPQKHKHPKVIHTKPTPRAGGLAIYIAILLGCIIFLPPDKHLVAILMGATILVVMSILDDKFHLNPYLRLGVQFVAALIPISSGIGISFITNPFGGGVVDFSGLWIIPDIIAVFWIVIIINFLNMGAKGVDGQLTGVTAISAIVLLILSLKFSADITEWPVTILAAITAGAFLGFLPWHVYPQKIMPSFAGSNLGGFFLAVISILSTTKVGTLMLVLAVPLVDTSYTIVRRIISGKSPVWGDRGHLHHKLLDIGWSKHKIAVFYWSVTAFLGFTALNLNAESKLYTMIFVALLIGGVIIWLSYQLKSHE